MMHEQADIWLYYTCVDVDAVEKSQTYVLGAASSCKLRRWKDTTSHMPFGV